MDTGPEQSDFSRQIFLMFWGLSMIFEFVGRSGLKNFIKKKMMNDRNLSAMIVVTTDELVESCLKEFENLPYRGICRARSCCSGCNA